MKRLLSFFCFALTTGLAYAETSQPMPPTDEQTGGLFLLILVLLGSISLILARRRHAA